MSDVHLRAWEIQMGARNTEVMDLQVYVLVHTIVNQAPDIPKDTGPITAGAANHEVGGYPCKH
ncbi:hypothetical protein J6590_000281 [Homalodisca vitripennis]|nr:hypothetical protein J6590_000281 [Homalodisca vitripennis]